MFHLENFIGNALGQFGVYTRTRNDNFRVTVGKNKVEMDGTSETVGVVKGVGVTTKHGDSNLDLSRSTDAIGIVVTNTNRMTAISMTGDNRPRIIKLIDGIFSRRKKVSLTTALGQSELALKSSESNASAIVNADVVLGKDESVAVTGLSGIHVGDVHINLR